MLACRHIRDKYAAVLMKQSIPDVVLALQCVVANGHSNSLEFKTHVLNHIILFNTSNVAGIKL